MKKIYLAIATLALISCSIEKSDAKLDGKELLIEVTDLGESNQCETGGVELKLGTDVNKNEVIDLEEVETLNYICNGIDGEPAYTTLFETELNTTECEVEGITIISGLDLDRDGVLGSQEILTEDTLCNGLTGQQGAQGESGLNYLVLQETVNNGTVVKSGLDTNSNGVLEDSEVTSSTLILNGLNGDSGSSGSNGLNSLVTTSIVSPSNILPNGGIQVNSGLDINTDGLLQDSEVISISYVENGRQGLKGEIGQNGINGLNSLINILENTPQEGSTTVESGLDLNENGVLDSDEVNESVVILDGEDGSDGEEGICSFIITLDEPVGENCETGGVKILTGKDFNRNKEFDEDEITSTSYICNSNSCVSTEEITYTYTFERFNTGDIVNVYEDLTMYGYRNNFEGNQFMIFDSENVSGEDDDLVVNSGNIGIISEDNNTQNPDDNKSGGIMYITFEELTEVVSLDVIDIDDSHSTITFYGENNTKLSEVQVSKSGDSKLITQTLNEQGVKKMVINLCESGAIDNLKVKKIITVNNCN